MTTETRQRRLAYTAWPPVCLIWGTTYLGIRICLETMPPMVMGGLRWTLAGILLLAMLRLRGEPLPSSRHWGRLAVLAFLFLFLGNGGVVWAEQWVPSGLTAVIVATSPFWMVGLDAILPQGEKLSGRRLLGLLVGSVGIVLLVWPEITLLGGGRQFALGLLALQIACFGWALGSIYSKHHAQQGNAIAEAAIQMVFGGVLMLIAATLLSEWQSLSFNTRTTLGVRVSLDGRFDRRIRRLPLCAQAPSGFHRLALRVCQSRHCRAAWGAGASGTVWNARDCRRGAGTGGSRDRSIVTVG